MENTPCVTRSPHLANQARPGGRRPNTRLTFENFVSLRVKVCRIAAEFKMKEGGGLGRVLSITNEMEKTTPYSASGSPRTVGKCNTNPSCGEHALRSSSPLTLINTPLPAPLNTPGNFPHVQSHLHKSAQTDLGKTDLDAKAGLYYQTHRKLLHRCLQH